MLWFPKNVKSRQNYNPSHTKFLQFQEVQGCFQDTDTLQPGDPHLILSLVKQFMAESFRGHLGIWRPNQVSTITPEPALSLQLQLPVKIRKFKFLIRSLLRLVSFGQESALQGGSCLKVNLTHCWKPQLHVQPLLLPAFSSPSTAWRPVIPPPPFEGLNSKQI